MAITDIFGAFREGFKLSSKIIDPSEKVQREMIKEEKREDNFKDKAIHHAMSYFDLCDNNLEQANKHRAKFKRYIRKIASS
jgi:hypothetical protein